MSDTEYISITGTFRRETDRAIQMTVDKVGNDDVEDSVTEWFPFSMCKSIYRRGVGIDELSVASWILQRKGLI